VPTSAPLSICLAGHVDHGKSSLLGRLLHALDLLPDGKVAALETASARRGVPIEWSFVLDAFQLERDQAITLDTTRVRVRTPHRELLVIDAPGHRELVRNLVTGAADTQAALLVVDAQSGAQQQTRRHLALLALLGVRDVVVAVNKMDVVDWAQARYAAVASSVCEATERLGLVAHAVVPVSARAGANLVRGAHEMTWWSGPSLVDALDSLPAGDARQSRGGPLRLPVQDIYRFDQRRIVAGRLQSGTLAPGDTVLVLPSGRSARVSSLEGWPQAPQRADAGDNVALQLDEPLVIERGDLLCDPDAAPKLTAVFDADVFWLGSAALHAGRRIDVRIGTREAGARIAAIHHVRDMDSLGEAARDSVGEGEVARVTIRCDAPVAVDDAATLRATGRFVIAEGGLIVGGGTIDATGYPDQRQARGGRGDHVVAVRHQVDAVERARRAGHAGGVVWLTGLSGAGKSTLAMALERRLFDLGWSVYTLDGDNVRRGLNADLGFAPEDRQENIRRIGEVASLFADAGVVCITAFISPYRDDRERARAAAGERRFLEVFVASDLATCEARDPKGLYRKARNGEIRGMTGIDSPYEPPDAPDVVIDTARQPIDACVEQLLAATLARLKA
jgi:bifunctional enzyme CysN/CysC